MGNLSIVLRMKRAEKQARRNVTRKKAQKPKEHHIKLQRWATGGVAHHGERAVVTSDVTRLNSRFCLVKVKSESKPIKWASRSWTYVDPTRKQKKKKAAAKK